MGKKEEATDFNMALSEWERMKHQRAEIAKKPPHKDTGEFALDRNAKLTINDRFSKKKSETASILIGPPKPSEKKVKKKKKKKKKKKTRKRELRIRCLMSLAT